MLHSSDKWRCYIKFSLKHAIPSHFLDYVQSRKWLQHTEYDKWWCLYFGGLVHYGHLLTASVKWYMWHGWHGYSFASPQKPLHLVCLSANRMSNWSYLCSYWAVITHHHNHDHAQDQTSPLAVNTLMHNVGSPQFILDHRVTTSMMYCGIWSDSGTHRHTHSSESKVSVHHDHTVAQIT